MKSDFLISLNGLPSGKTLFRWKADGEFFKKFENPEIQDADLDIGVVVEKSGQYIGVDMEVVGQLKTVCDRCLGDLCIPVDDMFFFTVKSGNGQKEAGDDMADGREILFLPDDSLELDMSQVIYDYAYLALPIQKLHDEGECDEEVLKHLDQDGPVGNVGDDSPFGALKGLFDN